MKKMKERNKENHKYVVRYNRDLNNRSILEYKDKRNIRNTNVKNILIKIKNNKHKIKINIKTWKLKSDYTCQGELESWRQEGGYCVVME